MGAPRPASTTLLELSRARAEALLRSDQEAVTEREEAARAKAKEVRERIARRKAYGNNPRAASPAKARQSPPASANSSARSTSTTSSGARTRHASPKPARAAEPQAKLQAKPDPELAASLMLNGLFDRPSSLSDNSQRSSVSDPPSTTGWRCHALAETPRQAPLEPAATADPAATAQAALYSQHITALTDQIEALAACLREEQQARTKTEDKLKKSQEQVRALSSRSKARAGSQPVVGLGLQVKQ